MKNDDVIFNQSSSSVSIEVVSQPWNPLLDISQPQVEAASEESKLLSIQWKESAEGSIQNTIASPNLYCNCESPSGSRLNKVNPFDRFPSFQQASLTLCASKCSVTRMKCWWRPQKSGPEMKLSASNVKLTRSQHPDVDVKETGQFSVALAWQPPECGSVGEYHVELRGKGSQLFDVHRQTVAQPSASITGLLSGTEYGVRIRAVDRSRTLGPWNEELTTVSTKGDVPESSADVSIEYKSSTEARIRWKHFDDERLQHYEVILVELDKNEMAQRSERSRVAPTENSMLFTDMAPQTEYKVGVVAYVDHEPKHVYRLTFSTADQSTLSLEMAPVVVKEGAQHYQVHWKKPEGLDIYKFLVEYRPNNDSKWQKVSEERLATDGQESYSVAASELVDAFSVRVVFVDSKQTAVARSKEVLVSSGDQETACDADAGTVRSISVDSTANIGYEYSIWKPEDGPTPPETTSFSEKPSVLIEGLDTNNVYLFRLRSRLTNGHSPWSKAVEGLTVDQESGENIYRLRIVLSPPKSFLVWTPLPEHRENIANFKLSYKHSGQDKWTRIVQPPTFFKCPANIAESNDFCYDLRDLEYGKQYTSTLIYELRNSEWTSHGSPLFFILVEAADSLVSTQPNNLKITSPNPSSIEVRWLPPSSTTNRLNPGSNYNISVVALSEAWPQGQQTSQVFEFPDTKAEVGGVGGGFDDAPAAAPSLTLEGFQVEEMGSKAMVSWQVVGDPSTVRAYQVEQKSEADAQWRPASNYISNKGVESQSHWTKGDSISVSQPAALKASCQKVSQVPLTWSYPNEPTQECGLYFVISGTIDSVAIQQTVDGQSREHRFDSNPARNWRLQVGAVNRLGAGPVSALVPLQMDSKRIVNESAHRTRRSICDPRTDFWCRQSDYSTDAGDITRGALSGNGRGVFGYRVLFRTENTGWNPYGQMVPYVGDNEDYSQSLTGLLVGLPYQIQVQALDRNSYVLYTTADVAAESTCQAPTHPPSHLAVDAPDSRHIRLTWNPPQQSTWRCNSVRVENPDLQWTVKVRSVNSAGQSPWSASVSSRSPPASELIEGPFVTNIQGVPRLSWKSREGSDPDLIDHFIVEWRTRTQPGWTTHGSKIMYSGWQRPYTMDLTELPQGHTYEVHVKAVDHNYGTAFVSPSVSIQSSRQCSPPRSAPRGVETSPIGPTQIRLSWQPLPESEWNCDKIWYVVKYSSPETQGYKNLTQGEVQTVFSSKPYTQWQFEVQAANPAGASSWSRPQSSQTFSTAPGPVSDLNVLPQTADSLQLSWRPPQNPNGQVTGYEVTYQLISRGMCDNVPDRVITVVSDRPTHTIGQLHPHSKYRIGWLLEPTLQQNERTTREVQTDPSVPTAPPANVRIDNVEGSNAELSWHAHLVCTPMEISRSMSTK
uniref:Fibronectin type-III domain-containing protein n=1 Tax=Ditylenchus dipsaci TaxID=166011 RepID=A0A915DIS7_9BILA